MWVKRIFLSILLSACALASVQQSHFTQTNKAVLSGGIPATLPYSNLSTWRLDITVNIPATDSTVVAWGGAGSQTTAQIGSYPNEILIAPYIAVSNVSFIYEMFDYRDSQTTTCPAIPFGQEYAVRFQGFANQLTCEVWKADNSVYALGTPGVITAGSGFSGTFQIGDANSAQGYLAFVRWYSTTVPLGSTLPNGPSGGDLADYEFGGNLNDSSTHSLTLTATGSFAYTTTPISAPTCNTPTASISSQQASYTIPTLCFPLNWGSTLTYATALATTASSPPSLLNPPGGGTFTGAATSTPTFTPTSLPWGVTSSYQFNVTVTDSSSQSATFGYKIGAVQATAGGNVTAWNATHAAMLGPLTACYAGPWAFECPTAKLFGNLAVQQLAGPVAGYTFNFVDYWNTPVVGSTATVTNGSGVVNISTGDADVTFCGGAGHTTPLSNMAIVIFYPILNAVSPSFNGTTGRRFGSVSACTPSTVTAVFPSTGNNWLTDSYVGAGSGLAYSHTTYQGCVNWPSTASNYAADCSAIWGSNSFPTNFYDNVKALYALYYRTGLDDYLVAARALADRWWSYPNIDKGLSYETTSPGGYFNTGYNFFGKELFASVTGLSMRNTDSPPYDYGPGLRSITNWLLYQGTPAGTYILHGTNCPDVGALVTTCGQDVRYGGYALKWVAEDYNYNSGPNGASPNTAQASLDAAALNADLTNRWGQCQIVSGTSDGICYNWDTINAGPGNAAGWGSSWIFGYAVTIANTGAGGTGVITASGGTFLSADFGATIPTALWPTSTGATQPISNLQGDNTFVHVVYADSIHLHIVASNGTTLLPYTGSQTCTSSATCGFQYMTANIANNGGGSYNYLGFYSQPYYYGILNSAYWEASKALAASGHAANAANALQWIQNDGLWLYNYGIDYTLQGGFVTNAPWYAVGITCGGALGRPVYSAMAGFDQGCEDSLNNARALAGEALAAQIFALRVNPFNLAIRVSLNGLMGGLYANPGEPGYSGTNNQSYILGAAQLQNTLASQKWFGVNWGQGDDGGSFGQMLVIPASPRIGTGPVIASLWRERPWRAGNRGLQPMRRLTINANPAAINSQVPGSGFTTWASRISYSGNRMN